MSKLKRGPSDTAYYKKYKAETTYEKNKLTKLNKVVQSQPNNEQARKALEDALKNGIKYKRRKSAGHKCKGLYKMLGFEENQMSESMKKSNLGMHWFCGINLDTCSTPLHTQSMCEQLEALGFTKKKKKYVKRKYKKTS